MPHFFTTRRIALTPAQAYAIAADVASYKEFLPLLNRSTVRGEKQRHGNTEIFDADLQVAFEKLGLRESFTSHVVADSDNRLVTATSSDGPLKSLKAVWKIVVAPDDQTDVSIAIDYTLKSMMLQIIVGKFMDFAAQKILQAFEERGRVLYGAALS